MSSSLARRRCLNHPAREASARCPACGRFFCRECVTDHDDRVICSACLRRAADQSLRASRRRGFLASAFRLLIGVFVAWVFFRTVGGMLAGVPSQFHDGAFWNEAVLRRMEAP